MVDANRNASVGGLVEIWSSDKKILFVGRESDFNYRRPRVFRVDGRMEAA
jgi:hypothetical protein